MVEVHVERAQINSVWLGIMWARILVEAVKKNGLKQFVFYLSNLDAWRFIEFTKACEYLGNRKGIILELGSGYSILPRILSNNGDLYITLDLSKNACKYQKSKNVAPIVADMRYLPFKRSSISNIIAISSIEHVPKDFLVFAEIRRVLKNDGISIISLPFTNKNCRIKIIKHSELLMGFLNRFKKYWRVVLGDKHINYFIEQTNTDAIMKYYTFQEIEKNINQNDLTLEEHHMFGKYLMQLFFKNVPQGWFVIKDFIIGWFLWKIENSFLQGNTADSVIIKIRKEDIT